MDLNARVNGNFARVDVNFQTVTVTLFYYQSFFILISINIKVLLILHTKYQPNIHSRFGEMVLNALVDVIFYGRRKFSNDHCDLIPLQIFLYFNIIQHQGLTNIHTKFQPNILS